MEKWIAKAVGLMHVHKITHQMLAQKLFYTREYITLILNGKKKPKGIKDKILNAIYEIIEEQANVSVSQQNQAED